MVAAMELSPLYRTFQVYKFGNRKYNFLLNYFVVLNVWHGFVFCKIPISIPLNIETCIPRYFARRYSVRCWYRVPVYSPSLTSFFGEKNSGRLKKKSLLWCLTDKSGLEIFSQTPKEKKKCKIFRIFIVRGWFNQLQEFISAVVEPQIWGCISPTLQVTGINWLIDFISLKIGW